MEPQELEYWQAVTASSEHRWVEDAITRLNGNGNLFYTGGVNGVYMRVDPDGNLTVGRYEGAYPHIGEAAFTPALRQQFASADEAFRVACRLGGPQFLTDLVPPDVDQPEPEEEPGMTMEMGM